jgi:hypothetical protein
MPSRFIDPFDFKTIYVNYFLGNQLLFPFFFIIILSFVCAYMNISNTIFLILLALGSLMFASYMGLSIYILVLFVMGFILYKMFSRILQ